MKITNKLLENVVKQLNEITDNPVSNYKKTEEGFDANIGNYHINGNSLAQITNKGGAVTTIFHGTKKELFYEIKAFIKGVELGKKLAQ